MTVLVPRATAGLNPDQIIAARHSYVSKSIAPSSTRARGLQGPA